MPSARSIVALASATVALVKILFAAANPDAMVYVVVDPPALIGGLLAFGMGVSYRQHAWSLDKRSFAVAVAAVWVTISVFALPLTFTFAACSCAANEDIAHNFGVIAIITGPALLFLAAALPQRLVARG